MDAPIQPADDHCKHLLRDYAGKVPWSTLGEQGFEKEEGVGASRAARERGRATLCHALARQRPP